MHLIKCGASDYGKVKGEACREEGFHSKVGTINQEMTQYNYNLVTDREPPEDIDEYIKGLGVKRKIRADAVRCASLIVDYPKDETRPYQEFFEDMKIGLQKYFGIKDEAVLYAQVHLDERHPHLHFSFVPLVEKDKVYKDGHAERQVKLAAKEIFTQASLRNLHPHMQRYMKDRGYSGTIHYPEREKKYKEFMEHKLEKMEEELQNKQSTLEQSNVALFFAQNEIEKAQGVLEDTLETKNRNLGEIQKQEAILTHQQGLIQEKGQELAFFDEEVKKLKGELVEQEELKERKADILGKVKVPWEEYQGLYHLATVQEDVKQLQKSLTIEKAAVDQKLVELSEKDMRADEMLQEADKKLQEAEDRLQKAPHYKQKAIEYRNKAKELQKENEELQETVESQLSELASTEFAYNELDKRLEVMGDKIMEQEKELSLFRKVFGQLKDWVIDKLHKLLDLETVIREPEGKLSQINKLKDSQGYSHGPYAQSYGGKLQYFWTDEKGNKDNSNLEGCLRRAYYPLANEIHKENQELTRLLDQGILAKSVKAHEKYQEQEQTYKRTGKSI